jgi:hypothetical protein
MKNWKKSFTSRLLTLGVGIGFTLNAVQARPAHAIVGGALTGGAASGLVLAGALTFTVSGALSAGSALIGLARGIGGHNGNDYFTFSLVTVGIAAAGLILLDETADRVEFAPVNSRNRSTLTQILTPAQLDAYDQELEEIQLVHQEVRRDVEQAAAAHPFQNAEDLLRFSGESWRAHGSLLSADAQAAVATIAQQVIAPRT